MQGVLDRFALATSAERLTGIPAGINRNSLLQPSRRSECRWALGPRLGWSSDIDATQEDRRRIEGRREMAWWARPFGLGGDRKHGAVGNRLDQAFESGFSHWDQSNGNGGIAAG
jgi:hypothetical protein